MPFDAIIKVSFNSDVRANQAVNKALVGHPQNTSGPGPFSRVGTAAYSCRDASDSDVALALVELSNALLNSHQVLDSVSVQLVRHTQL